MGKVLQLAVLPFSYAHAVLHTYRVVFRDVHAAFRSEDIHSASHGLGGHVASVSTTSACLQLPDDDAASTLAARSVLVRYVLEEWGAGATLRDAVSQACIPSDGALARGASWRVRVQAPGRRTGLVNAHDPSLFRELNPILDTLPGPVRLKNAEEDVAVLLRGKTVVVGRVVARGCAADLLSQYRVADRAYRGSTTMDATLAFVTASFARVRRGDLVLDPFCGAPAESLILRATVSDAIEQTSRRWRGGRRDSSTATPSSRRRVEARRSKR